MAEASTTKRNSVDDLLLALLALLLVGSAVQNLPRVLQEQYGVDVGSPYLEAGVAVTKDTPKDSRVTNTDSTPFYDTTGNDAKELGWFQPGTGLVLKDGPQSRAGEGNFWYVEDPLTGRAGWVPERVLVRDGMGGLNASTPKGTPVRALLATPLRRAAGSEDTVGMLQKGERAEITDGPVVVNGSRWWYLHPERAGVDGWVVEAVLTRTSGNDWHIGTWVRTTRVVDLLERAGGGQITGMLNDGEQARVIAAPASVGGDYWWDVRTSDAREGWVPESALTEGGIQGFLRGALVIVLMVGAVLTVVLLAGLLYVTIRTNQIRVREAQRIRASMPKHAQPKRNERWDKVLEHVSSEHPNDWRLAIIEADVMLDELITRMGYQGMTLGDKLKQVARGDVRTVDAAWEAHRIRNQIAHEGSDFILTQREARRVIELYGAVFEEFRYI